VVVKEKLVV